MLSIIIVFFSCFAIITFSYQSSELSDLQQRINQEVNVEQINKNENIVKFKDDSCKIYFFGSINDLQISADDKASKTFMQFYTCFNCRIATWIINTVNNYTEILTKSYQTFNLGNNFYNTYFMIQCENWIKNLNSFMFRNHRILDILLNFWELNSYSSLLDTTLLKSILSLNFKINSINYLKNNNYKTCDRWITEILKIINSIQKYIIFNCNVLPNYNKSIFYGYSSILKEPESIEISDYISFLCDIGMSINFLPSYTINDILLENVNFISPIFKNEVLSLQIIAKNVNILLPNILEEVRLSGDND